MDEVPKSKAKLIGIFVAIAVIAAAAYWWFVIRKKKDDDGKKQKSSDEQPPTIYGSLGCPYTVKQMEKYPGHKFVDCTSEKCPEFVTAYPTTKFSDGRIEVGFS